jgi:hypothetical protein
LHDKIGSLPLEMEGGSQLEFVDYVTAAEKSFLKE